MRAGLASTTTEAIDYIGTPYLLHGREPPAWDCRGCAGFLRRALFDRPMPYWGDDFPQASGLKPAALAELMECLIAPRLKDFSALAAPSPGALVLLSVFNRPAHIGLMLDRRNFIHCLQGVDTVIETIDSPRWSSRVLGYYG